jgi:hypothetical protein
MKACPQCGEHILAVAKKCHYCGEVLVAEQIDQQAKNDEASEPHSPDTSKDE